MDTLFIIILLILIAAEATLILVITARKRDDGGQAETIAEIAAGIIAAELRTQRQEAAEETGRQRQESMAAAREQRQELLSIIGESNTQTAGLIQNSTEATGGTLLRFGQDQQRSLLDMQNATQKSLAEMQAATQKSLLDMQTAIRDKVDERLDAIQKANEQKLEEMRKTVDEKLEATLNTRLKNSFDTVSQQLEAVNVRLGELGTVAESVSSLNKTLSGSKTRGILGELQLSQIIEDILPSQLYEKDAQIGARPGDHVEYAIKFPGQEDDNYVYLPIDSKFPLEPYYKLLDGFENGDIAAANEARKELLSRIKTFAGDVRKKYVNPPLTTDFAVVFLPTEGLYAEAVRDAVFFEELRKQGIMLAGPTTLSAMLSSLLLGFKTLQIQKGAVDIQRTLEMAKAEFGKFGKVLVKAQTRIRQTGDELGELVGARTNKINKVLKNVQTYTYKEGEAGFAELELPGEEAFPEIELYIEEPSGDFEDADVLVSDDDADL